MSIARIMQQASAGVSSGGDAWTDPDLDNASYDSVSFSFSAQETSPQDLFFKADGTKVYVIGSTGDDVNEYDLSTAWDVSSASYLQNFSVSAQDTAPGALVFSPDGVSMYFVGYTNDNLYQYDLSTAWDVTSASYVRSFSVAAQEGNPRGLSFKDDGTKFYVNGPSGDKVSEYILSSAWDISTASYSQNFSISSQAPFSSALFFAPDGASFYVISSSVAYKYDVSTAWDISTSSYSNSSFSLTSQDTSVTGVFFKSDGAKMYIVGSANDTIYQYSTTAPASVVWTDPDLANTSYDSASFSVATSNQETVPIGLAFKPDGVSMFMIGNDNDTVYQYTLSTAWDLSTASYASKSFSIATQETSVSGLAFKPDGTIFYVCGSGTDDVFQYTLSTAWDISTASYASKSFSFNTQDTAVTGVGFNDDGTKMYMSGSINDTIFQYTLSTAWDVSTASYASKSFDASALDGNPRQLNFSPTGDKLWFSGLSSSYVHELDLSTDFDISTASYNNIGYDVSSQGTLPTAQFFKPDGSKMYVVNVSNDTIFQYST